MKTTENKDYLPRCEKRTIKLNDVTICQETSTIKTKKSSFTHFKHSLSQRLVDEEEEEFIGEDDWSVTDDDDDDDDDDGDDDDDDEEEEEAEGEEEDWGDDDDK